jgi:UDP-N-acetyl-D-mannosaminuronic acid dehydrogenase
VWEAIAHANRHPRVKYLRPGPGVGGHCIAVDPWFIVEAAPDLARLISTARSVNDAMPDHVVELARQAVGDVTGAAITTLGLTYKANVGDLRESPAVTVVEHLRRAGAVVRTHDPIVGTGESAEDAVAGASLLVLLVDHAAYGALDPRVIGPQMRSRVVLDTRGVLDRDAWAAAGFRVHTLGRAGASVLVGGQG